VLLHRVRSVARACRDASPAPRRALAKQAADRRAADKQADDEAGALSIGVWDDINALAQAADDPTASNPGLDQPDLEAIKSGFDTVKSDFDVFISGRVNGYTDSFCDDAAATRRRRQVD
jgi:hypothetical protein